MAVVVRKDAMEGTGARAVLTKQGKRRYRGKGQCKHRAQQYERSHQIHMLFVVAAGSAHEVDRVVL